MSNFTKSYIGKGKKHATLDIITVHIAVDACTPFIREHEGVKYLSFEVAGLQSPDQKGRTHTAYVRTKQEGETPKAEAAPVEKKPSSKKAKA